MTTAYDEALGQETIEPRYVIALSFDDDDTDITYITSHSDALVPAGVVAIDRIDGAISARGISGQTQKISPDKAQHTIGNVSFSLLDVNGEISTKIKTKLDGGEGLRQKRIQLYKGETTLTSWDDYQLILTYLVDGNISYKDGIYKLACSDIQRTAKETIMTPHQANLTSTIDASTLTIPVTAADALNKFPQVEHDYIYGTDSPADVVVAALDLSNAAWSKSNVTITTNAATGPDGVVDADKVTCDGTTDPTVGQSYDTGAALGGRTFRFDCWLKTDSGQPTEATLFIYDSSAGDVGFTAIVLSSDWQKFTFYHTFGGAEADTSVTFRVDPVNLPTAGDYLYYGGSQFAEIIPVGYIKIDDEIIAHSGWNGAGTELTATQRGAFGTVAVGHTVTATDTDKKKKVEEYIYLEMAAPKMIYALLTGILDGQPATLPTHWHLGIATKYVDLAGLQTLGDDLWNPTTGAGRIARFMGLSKEKGKDFIEKELALWSGIFMRIQADGSYSPKRFAPVLPYSAYSDYLDEDEIIDFSDLVYDQPAVINDILIEWNWLDQAERFTKINQLIDSNSVSKYNTAKQKKYEFRGVFTGRHTDQDLQDYFNVIRDRYAAPPLRLKLTLLPKWDSLEVGDTVRVSLGALVDSYINSPLDRVFEVQGKKTDWKTGKVSVDLFGGVEPASAGATSTTDVMQDSFYTATGTDLSTVLTIVSGVVTADATVTGADLNADAIYYYNGDLEIDTGVTVTFTKNVQLRIKGFLTVNGGLVFEGATSLAGAMGATFTRNAAWVYGFLNIYQTKLLNSDSSNIGQYAELPIFPLTNPDGLSISGLPGDLSGVVGVDGADGKLSDPTDFTALGGAGGAGGGGAAIICRGAGIGASGTIDTSGGNGSAGSSITGSTRTVYGQTGAGGHPGAALFLIDGNYSTPTFTSSNAIANNGLCADPAGVDVYATQNPQAVGSGETAYGQTDIALVNKFQGLIRAQYIPAPVTPFVWYPADEESEATGYGNPPPDWADIVDDGGKPSNNADVTGTNTALNTNNVSDIPAGIVQSSSAAVWFNGIESNEYSDWTANAGHAKAAVTSDKFSGAQSMRVTTTTLDTDASATIGGVNIEIPERIALSVAGRQARISLYAKTDDAASFAQIAYSTNGDGDLGWRTFVPTSSWAKYSFTYAIPDSTVAGSDYFAIQSSTDGSVLIDHVAISTESTATNEVTHALQCSNWTERSTYAGGLGAIIYSETASKLIATGQKTSDGHAYSLTSTDGETWTATDIHPVPADTIAELTCLVDNGSIVVGGGFTGTPGSTESMIMTTTNGTAWTQRTVPNATSNPALRGIAYGNGLFVAVGNDDGTDAYIITSPDGITWTERSNASALRLQAVIYYNGLFVAVGENDGTTAVDAYILTSTDGITWTERTNEDGFSAFSISFENGEFIAAGATTDGIYIASPDGISWSARNLPSSNLSNIKCLSAGTHGILMAGAGGTMLSSIDGTNWSDRNHPRTTQIQDAIFYDNRFICVGDSDGTDAYCITSIRI